MAVDIRERDGSAPKVGKLLRFHEGEYMLREGDANVDMFQIVTGKAEVYLGYGTKQETLIGIIKDGTCFGEFGMLLKKPAIYTVIAYTEVLVLRLTEGEMGDFIRENGRKVMGIMRNMANMLYSLKFKAQSQILCDG